MRIVFIGTGEIGVPTLSALLESEHEVVGVVTQPDKPAGRDQSIEAPPIKKALAGTKMSSLQPARIKDRESIEQIRALTPDVIVVMAYGQILPRNVLEIPPTACLNLHASPPAIKRLGSLSCTWTKVSTPAIFCCSARSTSCLTTPVDRCTITSRKSRRRRCSNLCECLQAAAPRASHKIRRSLPM